MLTHKLHWTLFYSFKRAVQRRCDTGARREQCFFYRRKEAPFLKHACWKFYANFKNFQHVMQLHKS